jgi:type VI secretion system protein ImpL
VPLSDFGHLFAYGGVYDAFFSDHLAPLVDSSQSPWTWRQGSGSPSQGMLAQFEGAKRVREAFFRPGSQTPQAPFTVTIGDLDAGARRFVIQIDGQVFDNLHGKQPGSWPGQGPGLSDATFEDLSGPWPPQRFEGQWAWFRLIEAAQPQREGDLRAVLAFQRGNHHARVTVEAGSVNNPFAKRDWQGFSCGS